MSDPSAAERAALPALCQAGRFVRDGEALRLTVLNAASGVTVKVSGRFLRCDGAIERFSRTLTPATDRSASTLTMPLAEGWLLSAHAIASAGTPITGQCFALLTLLTGLGSVADDLETLAAGYVTAVQRLAWPGSGVQNSLAGAGAIRSIAGTTPAAGAEIGETVPTGARWELLAIHAQLTTSGAAANRLPALYIYDGTVELFRAQIGAACTATTVTQLAWGAGATQPIVASALTQWAPLPVGTVLGSGFGFATSTSALQAGDAYAFVRYLVREWLEGA